MRSDLGTMFNQGLIIIPEKEKLLENPNLCKTIITYSKHGNK